MDIKCDFSPKLCLKDVPGGFSMFICWFLLTPWVSKLKYSDWIYKRQVLGREFGPQSWMWGH